MDVTHQLRQTQQVASMNNPLAQTVAYSNSYTTSVRPIKILERAHGVILPVGLLFSLTSTLHGVKDKELECIDIRKGYQSSIIELM